MLIFSHSVVASAKAEPKQSDLPPSWFMRAMHYKKNWGSYFGTISDQKFFLSANGRIDPLAEWIANQNAISQDDLYPCRFPFRYLRMQNMTRIHPDLMRRCPQLIEWFNSLNSSGISYLFAAQYISHPASAFGHSFLHFRAQGTESLPDYPLYLDRILGFAAVVQPSEGAIDYAWNGLTGGYIGKFGVQNYFEVVATYSGIESRDLWSYPLLLDKDEIDLLFAHLYELINHGGIPYYFLDENCSYQLLALLEAVRLDWNLTDSFGLYVLPSETLQILKKNKALGSPSYLPSSRQTLMDLYGRLSSSDKQLFQSWLKSRSLTNLRDYSLPLVRAIDQRLAIESIREHPGEQVMTSEHQSVLEVMASLTSQDYEPPKEKDLKQLEALNPALIHPPRRFEIGASENSALISAGAGVHRLMDRPFGYLPRTSISILDGTIRVPVDDARNPKLDRLDIFEMFNLTEWSAADPSWSFYAKVGYGDPILSNKIDGPKISATAAGGQTFVLNSELFTLSAYGLLGGGIEGLKFLEAGPTCELGLILTQSSVWTLWLRAREGYGIRRSQLGGVVISATQRFSLWENQDLIVAAAVTSAEKSSERSAEIQFGYQLRY